MTEVIDTIPVIDTTEVIDMTGVIDMTEVEAIIFTETQEMIKEDNLR